MNDSDKTTVLDLKDVYEDRNQIFWYWCNACGDINIPGMDTLQHGEVEDMPAEARQLFLNVWSENMYQTCYVVQHNTTFGIALGILLDDEYIHNMVMGHEELKPLQENKEAQKNLRAQAGRMTAKYIADLLTDVTVFYGEGTDPDGDEILVFFPKDTVHSATSEAVLSVSRCLDQKYGYPVFEDDFISLAMSEVKDLRDIEKELKRMIADNRKNVKEAKGSGYDGGYAEGFHDAIVELLNFLHIQHDEVSRALPYTAARQILQSCKSLSGSSTRSEVV